MPTCDQVIAHLKRTYTQSEILAVAVWSTDDVLDRAARIGYTLTEDLAGKILNSIHERDASLGISWDMLNEEIRRAIALADPIEAQDQAESDRKIAS